MTQRYPQSTAAVVMFKAYLSSDHVTEATGKTIAITISKNGGAFGNPAAGATNATEVSSGWYKVSLGTGDTDTLGPLAIRGAVATIDDYGDLLEIVSATSGGYTNLDAAVSTRASQTSLDTLDDYVDTEVAAIKTQTDKLTFTIANRVDVQVLGFQATGSTGVRSAIGLATANLDTQLDALPTANENADALLDRAAGVETNRTLRQTLRLMLSATAGKASGLATTTAIYRDTNDSKDRITATVDADGNRTAITYDQS